MLPVQRVPRSFSHPWRSGARWQPLAMAVEQIGDELIGVVEDGDHAADLCAFTTTEVSLHGDTSSCEEEFLLLIRERISLPDPRSRVA